MCLKVDIIVMFCSLQIFERILYIWAIRHPASGYVQGMNDLVTPFFVVFLSEHVQNGMNGLDNSLSINTIYTFPKCNSI